MQLLAHWQGTVSQHARVLRELCNTSQQFACRGDGQTRSIYLDKVFDGLVAVNVEMTDMLT